MDEELWPFFITNLWQRENPDGYNKIEGKGGYSKNKYYPYQTKDGRWDIGPGFHLKDQSQSFQEKAKSGFTEQELNDTVIQHLHNEPQLFRNRIIKEGGDPDKVPHNIYAGLLDMFWQTNNQLYKEFPKFWKAVARRDYEGMRRESRTTYDNLVTGKKKVPDIGRWNFRKQTYFHDPQPLKAKDKPIDSSVYHWQWKEPPKFELQKIYAEGGEMKKPSLWDDLSLEDKSEVMASAVRNGLTTLPEIRDKWNEYANGGHLFAGGAENEPADEGTPPNTLHSVSGKYFDDFMQAPRTHGKHPEETWANYMGSLAKNADWPTYLKDNYSLEGIYPPSGFIEDYKEYLKHLDRQ